MENQEQVFLPVALTLLCFFPEVKHAACSRCVSASIHGRPFPWEVHPNNNKHGLQENKDYMWRSSQKEARKAVRGRRRWVNTCWRLWSLRSLQERKGLSEHEAVPVGMSHAAHVPPTPHPPSWASNSGEAGSLRAPSARHSALRTNTEKCYFTENSSQVLPEVRSHRILTYQTLWIPAWSGHTWWWASKRQVKFQTKGWSWGESGRNIRDSGDSLETQWGKVSDIHLRRWWELSEMANITRDRKVLWEKTDMILGSSCHSEPIPYSTCECTALAWWHLSSGTQQLTCVTLSRFFYIWWDHQKDMKSSRLKYCKGF